MARDRGILNVPSVNWLVGSSLCPVVPPFSVKLSYFRLVENVPMLEGLGWSLRAAAAACRLPLQAISTLSVTPADVARGSRGYRSPLCYFLCGCGSGRTPDAGSVVLYSRHVGDQR
jgi:hypothetical protein